MKFFTVKTVKLPTLFVLFFAIYSCQSDQESDSPAVVDGVTVLDGRLELTLMKQDPDIVTPIGIAVDDRDRVYVLESHTHLPPKDYPGPKHDRIKVYEDSNGDGKWDKETVFAEGLMEGLTIAFSPDGYLHAVTSKEVWKFYDEDGDAVSERREKLMGLTKPEQVYAHAAMLSIAFDTAGWMYIGRGNTGAAHWIFQGSDGSEVEGYGDGGNIIRAKTDGSGVEIFSTGYWNPFDLKFDNYGRLLVADNDPDSRGPNRLLHAVQGSDFGYKSLFGGSGIHPYSAWNGELPGTLPYAVALGESPSGLLNASLARLPQDYSGQMLCTIWEESSIVRIAMQPKGVSITGTTEIILQGGADFRPVALATDSQGNIYFTDWVERVYPNHGKGKIWKLAAKDNVELLRRRNLYDNPEAHPAVEQLNKLSSATDFGQHMQHLQSEDPFVRHFAVMALREEADQNRLRELSKDSSSAVRLGALLALRDADSSQQSDLIDRFLADPDPDLRKMALIRIGSQGMVSKREQLESVFIAEEVTTSLFETYLETVKMLEPSFMEGYWTKSVPISKNNRLTLPEDFISNLIGDPGTPTRIKSYALRYLQNPAVEKDLLMNFLAAETSEEIQLEIIQTLAEVPDGEVFKVLLQLILSTDKSDRIRSEALSVLSLQPLQNWQEVIPLLYVSDENLALASAKFLAPKSADEQVKKAMEDVLTGGGGCDSEVLRQQLMLILRGETGERPRPDETSRWVSLLDGPADVDRGRRVFFSNMSLCSSCHIVDGRGGDLGPDLSQVGKSKNRNGLISSILQPSGEMSPEWQGWYIKLKDGNRYDGRQIDVGENDIKLYTQSEGFVRVEKAQIADYGMSKTSLMPDGLHLRLTNQDLRDLLAFLENH